MPLNAQIELTLRCNARCVFCSIWKRDFQKEVHQEMKTEEVKRIIDDLEKLGVQILVLTGGEPTLRKDLPELLSYTSEKGMIANIATNGFNLYDLVISGKLKDVGWVMVSIDWPDAARHNKYRKIDVFDNAVKGIKALVKLRKSVLISSVVTKENIGCMEEMCIFAKKLGAMIEMLPCENIIREQDSTHIVENIDDFIPDVVQYSKEIRRLNKRYSNLITDTATANIIEAGGFGNQNLLHCVIARSFLVINYKGEVVFPCKLHPILKVDIKKRSIYDIYHSFEAKAIMDEKDSFPFCKGCRFGCAIAASIPSRWSTLYEKYIKAFFSGNLF